MGTVRSRAMTFRMQLFPPREIADYLKATDPRAKKLAEASPERFDAAVYGAGGSIGVAKDSLDPATVEELTERREIVRKIITAVANRVAYPELYAAFSALPQQKRQELCELLIEISTALRDMILIKRAPDTALL